MKAITVMFDSLNRRMLPPYLTVDTLRVGATELAQVAPGGDHAEVHPTSA